VQDDERPLRGAAHFSESGRRQPRPRCTLMWTDGRHFWACFQAGTSESVAETATSLRTLHFFRSTLYTVTRGPARFAQAVLRARRHGRSGGVPLLCLGYTRRVLWGDTQAQPTGNRSWLRFSRAATAMLPTSATRMSSDVHRLPPPRSAGTNPKYKHRTCQRKQGRPQAHRRTHRGRR